MYKLHMFPKEKTLRNLWVSNCTGEIDFKTPNDKLKTTLRICGRHFENHLFKNAKTKSRLQPNAVPTLFHNFGKKCKFLKILKYILYVYIYL